MRRPPSANSSMCFSTLRQTLVFWLESNAEICKSLCAKAGQGACQLKKVKQTCANSHTLLHLL